MTEGIVQSQFVFDTAPFASCHAATLVETESGELLCAFFGGSREGKPDVSIYLARLAPGAAWSEPRLVADGVQPDGSRFPCWNPVLFQARGGPLTLFFKVGPSPSKWWGMTMTSDDDGRTWGEPARLPPGILGPAKNKPVQLPSGVVLSPCSAEFAPDDESHAATQAGWRIYFERSDDAGRTWRPMPFVQQGDVPKATQPTLLVHSPTRLQALARTTSGRLCETWSHDAGETWSPLAFTNLPNCNSGIDAVTLSLPLGGRARVGEASAVQSAEFDVTRSAPEPNVEHRTSNIERPSETVAEVSDVQRSTFNVQRSAFELNVKRSTSNVEPRTENARHLLVYNHSNIEKVRYPLNVATSTDGKDWRAAAILEHEPPGQYSYPCVIQTRDGLVHVAYTWKRRRIRHAAINPEFLRPASIDAFTCPPPGSPTHRVDASQ